MLLHAFISHVRTHVMMDLPSDSICALNTISFTTQCPCPANSTLCCNILHTLGFLSPLHVHEDQISSGFSWSL